MALEDIDGLSEEINENQTGHIDDHKKIVRGLKSLKKEAKNASVKPKLAAQPARRLFDQSRMEIGTRPLIIPWITASTGEGSVADNDKTIHVLLQKMFQSSYNPPGISGGYSLKVRAWDKTGSTGEVLDIDTKKISILNTGATATHTSFTPSTGIDIMYPSGPGCAPFTISIDGGAPVTVTPGTAESYIGVWRSPVLTRAIHTYVITGVSDGAKLGLTYIRDQDEKSGIRLYNFGRAGGGTTQFINSEADSTWARINSIVPDAAIIMLGHNNMPNSITQMKADFDIICDRLEFAAGRPIWIAFIVQHSTDSRWEPYALAIEEFAETRPNIITANSYREYFATNTVDASTSGEYYTDNLHLNEVGHAIAADIIADSFGLPSRKTWPALPATTAQDSVDPGAPDVTSGLNQRFTFDLALSNGSSVSSVAPSAGIRGLNLTQATSSKQPTYISNFANGHGGLRFTRANSQNMETALFGAANNNTIPATLVAVFKRNVTTAAGYVIHGGVFNSVSTGLAIDAEITSSLVRANTVNGGNLATTAPADTNIHVVIAVFDGTSSKLYVDGNVFSGTLTAGEQNALPRIRVGTNVAATANYGDFDLGHIEEFDRALSSTEAQYLNQQLKNKFGLA